MNCRDLFITVAGPSVACLCAIFEQAEDEELLHESMRGLLAIAHIAQYSLEDILDQLLTCFCKFTTLLNPYATLEETLFTFSHNLKPRLATLAVFTVANKYGNSIHGGWRNMVDCLLKLKRLKLLPHTLLDLGSGCIGSSQQPGQSSHSSESDSGVIFPWSQQASTSGASGSMQPSGLLAQFTQFLSLEDRGSNNVDDQDSIPSITTDFENNTKLIQQCQIGNIFANSSKLPNESLVNLGRALIFAAAGKNQKFSTSVEEEETVGFCWDILVSISTSNIHRFGSFWSQFNDYFSIVVQFPLFSPCPFAEKAIVGIFAILERLLSTPSRLDKLPEELILKSITFMWKLDKEILDTCCEPITESIAKILTESPQNVQSTLCWKTLLHLLSISGRHPETYDQSVGMLVKLMSEGTHINRFNYAYFIDAGFGFTALKISPLENSLKILDLMSSSVEWLVQWHKSTYSDPGSSNASVGSNGSNSSMEDAKSASGNTAYLASNLFLKLSETLRKTSLVRREEIRNHAVTCLRKVTERTEELELSPATCITCFNLVVFAMVDDLLEKTLEYSRRENSEREMRSMEGTLKESMELMTSFYLRTLMKLQQSSGFRSFWLSLLRRMDTSMKAEIGGGVGLLQEIVPKLLKRMIVEMQAKGVLTNNEDNELWDITNIQIQWIAPSIKDDLFPD